MVLLDFSPSGNLELLGYLASVLIAISMFMNSIVPLRLFNLFGCIIFAIYGILIGSLPVALTNILITGINLFFLIKYRFNGDKFDFVEIVVKDENLVNFVLHHRADIDTFFPDINFDEEILRDGNTVFLVLRNFEVIGIVIGSFRAKGIFEIIIDYVTPRYRNLKSAKYFFTDNSPLFKRMGVQTLVAKADNPVHEEYLTRIGFEKQNDLFVRSLDI